VTSLLRRLAAPEATESRFTLNDYLQLLNYGGTGYPLIQGGTPGGKAEVVENSFTGYVEGIYKRNGVVFACMAARLRLFSEARFQFRRMKDGRPGDLFGTQDLAQLESPWPGATTGDMLARMITDADLAGNAYVARRPGGLVRLRPDWVTIISGSRTGLEIDTELIGYLYHPTGLYAGEDPLTLLPEHVAHFAPMPDPLARHRGMSWLTPVLEEILGDLAASCHKRTFFDNGAKLGYVVTLDKDVVKNVDQFQAWVDKFKQGHEGSLNAYKTLFLAGGADVKTVGADMRQIDFSNVQGHGETRIASAAGVPPIIVGLSEGLDAATYSNYSQARRAFADETLRPLWRNICGSLTTLVNVPAGAELWYDDRDISFLQEDQQDAAVIQQTRAATIRSLIEAGFLPDSARDAVLADDFTLLEHSDLFSVQLQAPGSTKDPLGITPSGGTAPQEPSDPGVPSLSGPAPSSNGKP
jgi:HK97 family phage portal protein